MPVLSPEPDVARTAFLPAIFNLNINKSTENRQSMAVFRAKCYAVVGVALFILILWSYPLLTARLAAQWDVGVHLRWADQFYSGLQEGWWMPRWASASLNGLGDPTFLYYQPLFYYLSSAFAFMGVPFQYWLLLSAVTIYGMLGAVVYRCFLRQYRIRNAAIGVMFVLSSPAIFFLATQLSAFPWILSFPISLMFIAESVRERPRWLRLAVLIALVCLTHVLSAMMTLLCTAFGRAVFAFPSRKTLNSHLAWAGGVALGLGLASFYLYPAITQLGLITPSGWTSNFNWRRAFALPVVTYFQYGTSWFGPQWSLPFLALGLSILALLPVRAKEIAPISCTAHRLAIIALAALILGSEIAYPLYSVLSPLQKLQFPYRFAFLAILLSSIALVIRLNQGAWSGWNRFTRMAVMLLVTAYAGQMAILEWKLYSSGRELPGRSELMQGRFGQPEYLPAVAGPQWKSYAEGGKLDGECQRLAIACSDIRHRTHDFSVVIDTSHATQVRLPIFAFPAWEATVDGEVRHYVVDKDTGMFQVSLAPGKHLVALQWKGLPAEVIGWQISVLAFCVAFAGYFTKRERRQNTSYVVTHVAMMAYTRLRRATDRSAAHAAAETILDVKTRAANEEQPMSKRAR